MKQLLALIKNTRGVATIEFALTSLFLFGAIMVALDFGYNIQQRVKLGQAVEQGSILAFNQQPGANVAPISNYVKSAAGTQSAPTVTVTCNTTSCGDGKCSCINASGNFVAANSCNEVCPGSSAISGNYMKIVATMPYRAVIVPNKWLGGTTITSSAVVRLQ